MPEEGVQWLPHSRILSFEQIRDVVAAAVGLGFDKVRLTGGEPLVRKGIEDLVSMLSGIPGLSHLAMTSNGTLLAPLASVLASNGLRSINISLDTLDPERYASITRGGKLSDAIDGILEARSVGLAVKLNVVVSPDSASEQLAAIEAFAQEHGCLVQTIREYRLDEKKRDDERFMRPPPCYQCDRIRLLATGELKPCLHGDASIPVDFSDIPGSILRCIALKPPCGAEASEHVVSAIGG